MSDIDKLAERIAERLTEEWEAGGVVETAQVIAAELRKEYQTPPDSGLDLAPEQIVTLLNAHNDGKGWRGRTDWQLIVAPERHEQVIAVASDGGPYEPRTQIHIDDARTLLALLNEVRRLRSICDVDGLNPDMPIFPGLNLQLMRAESELAALRAENERLTGLADMYREQTITITHHYEARIKELEGSHE